MLLAGNLVRQPAYEGVEFRVAGELRETDRATERVFIVGLYPALTDEQIDYVIATLRDAPASLRAGR